MNDPLQLLRGAFWAMFALVLVGCVNENNVTAGSPVESQSDGTSAQVATASGSSSNGSGTKNSAATGSNAGELAAPQGEDKSTQSKKKELKLPLTDAQWRARLTDMQFRVTRKHGTERAFTNAYWNNNKPGIYSCVCCGDELFASDHKYDSKTGWPSFWQPAVVENIGFSVDYKLFYRRTEVHCKRCGAHLGHVFDDGPRPTGKRFCINSASLDFQPRSKQPGDSSTESPRRSLIQSESETTPTTNEKE